MKKILVTILAIAIVFSMALSVNAEVENFLRADALWTKGTATKGTVTVADGIASCSGIDNAWCCPSIDILPSIKDAIGEDEEVELTISFEARAVFTAGNEGSASTGRVLLRGTNGIAGLSGIDNAEAWTDAYAESLDGEDPLFQNSKGNIMKFLGGNVDLLDEEWSVYTVALTLYSSQVNNPSVLEWKLTLDNISEPENIELLQFRNVIITTEEIEVEHIDPPVGEGDGETATDEKPATDDKPVTDEKPATDEKPVTEATQKPAVQTSSANENIPVNNTENSTIDTNALIITACICGAIIIITLIGAVIVVKKKTSK